VIAAIGIEGILAADPKDDRLFASRSPIQSGLRLVAALKQMYKLVFITDELDVVPVEHFLKVNQAPEWAYLLARREWQADADATEARLQQLDTLRGDLGMAVALYLDADPQAVAGAMMKGIPSLLMAHPQYARPEWRPDDERGVKSWAEIQAGVLRQKELKGQDPRLAPNFGL
jgi:hypothetical protein